MNYSILDPTGNITAIIGHPVEAERRVALADRIMKKHPSVEQVGFLLSGNENYDGELQMAGGEFCGNASMSAATILAMNENFKAGDEKSILLKVSGNPKLVQVELKALTENTFKGKVAMPAALDMKEIVLPDDVTVPVVIMPGIIHALVPESYGLEKAESMLPSLCEQLGADALGMMLLNDARTRIHPIVYVPGANTLVHEHSCASGTAAVGAYLASKTGEHIKFTFEEPGGSLTVTASPEGEIYIEGTVSLTENSSI